MCKVILFFYLKVPRNMSQPCELCYCIRNKTLCVIQECQLNAENCEPLYIEGVCCPVKYICGKLTH